MTSNDATFSLIKRAKQEWESSVDALPQLICLLDREQQMLRCNRTVERWKLASVHEVRGRPVVSLFGHQPQFKEKLDHAWEQLLQHESDAFEIDHLLPMHHFFVQVHPVATETYRGEHPGDGYAVMVINDITEQKSLDAQTFELALEKERAELLRQFITDVTHDFKTPLAIINTSLYLMEKVEDEARQKMYAQRIEQQVTHLSKMVDSLLAMVRLSEKSEFEFEPVNINSMIQEVYMIMQDEADEKGHQFLLEPDSSLPHVPVESSEMRQALVNMVENAINYSERGSRIILRTYSKDSYVVIEVQDSGIGIAESEIPHIFKRFYRANKARQIETGRAGLGLPFVKNVVDVHMGKIEVESEAGVGSTFRILLPLHPH